MELINSIRKSRKGFTLVEIIVVLVILAVLAAFTIPSMIGFVNEAKKKAAIAEQREIYVAAQAVATEYYGKHGSTNGLVKLGVTGTFPTASPTVVSELEAVNLGSVEVAKFLTANKIADATAKKAALALIPDTTKAMGNYVDTDITAGVGTTGTNTSAWTVFVDANGKVTKITYQKDDLKLDDLVPSASVK
ncbi:type II secretion system protein [uncultured Acetobacterium sp.]|uniref:type II secretion system protein n=1 Tax=uncultured Acetobacterium sp. TaxID=217139 RepID=UPI0025DB16A6|nr:type II secretion system protein [uncultured Acetobacterium sp.]